MTSPRFPSGAARALLTWAVLSLLVLAAYWPAVRGGLLWDDDAHLTKPALQTTAGLVRIWIEPGATQQYYPLLHSAFWVEHRLWGDATAGYHLVNLLQHALAATLVIALMRRLALPGAWLGGALFALHPVCVESVAWISEQKNTLSAVFYLAAALCYLRFDADRRHRWYFLALGGFVLALLTKTVTATLPAALLVIFWWQRGRLDWKRDVLPLLPWFALSLAAGLFTAWMERKFIGAEGHDFTLTILERLLLAGRVVCFYFGKLLWPADLVFIYPRWTLDASVWWQWLFLAGVALTGLALLRRARRQRGPLAAFLLYGGTLFPALGFFNVYPFLFSYVADHFQYLASLAVIIPAAALVARVPGHLRLAAHLCAGLILLAFALLTWRQAGLYRDAETLYRDVLARNPACWLAENNLGNIAAQDPSRLAEAATRYEAVIALRPGFASAHYNLANTLAKIPGRAADAIDAYEAALRLQPDFAEAANHLGNLLVQQPGRLPDAIARFETAVRLDPGFSAAHVNLANALSSDPARRAEAIAHYETALRLTPDFPDAHFNLANLWAKAGQPAQAIPHYEAALRLRPGFVEAHVNLANLIFHDPSRRAEAIAHYEAALALRPDLTALRRHVDRLKSTPR